MKITQRVFRLNLCLGAAAAVTLLSAFFWLIFEERLERTLLSNVQSLQFDLLETRASLERVHEALELVADSGLASQFLTANPNNRPEAIRRLLHSMLDIKKDFVQVRVLDVQGVEVLRLDRQDDEVVLKSEDSLQDKSRRSYMKMASSFPVGTLLYSDITLNEEQEKIEQPEWAALRGIAVLGDEEGNRIGYFIVNVRMDEVLAQLATSPYARDAIVFDHTGRYLYHSDRSKTFAPQRGVASSFAQDSPELFKQMLASSGKEQFDAKLIGEDSLFGHFIIPGEVRPLSIFVVRTFDKTALTRGVIASLVEYVWVAVIVLLAIWFVGWITSRYLERRFHLLNRIVGHFQQGELTEGRSLIQSVQKQDDEVLESGKAFLKLVDDITQTSNQLEFANNKIKRVFNSISSAIIVAGEDGTIIDCNKASEDIFGYSALELQGKNVKTLMPSSVAEKHDDYMRHAELGTGSRTLGVVRALMAVRKSGERFPIELSLSEVQASSGLMFVAVVTDLSNLKKTQSDLARYVEELRQSNLDLQKYAYALSHDLKAPIRKITLFSQMIDRKKLSEEDLHHIERIEGSAHKASAMIDALLNLASFEASNAEFEERDLESIARDAVVQARESYPDVDIEVVYEGLPSVQCDATLIGSVFVNLIVNALKYGQAQGKLDLRIYSQDNWSASAKAFSRIDSGVCILVEDKGKGIAEADQEAVFDIFYRIKRGELKNVEGSGVGLSTCRRIMEVHGGSIFIDPDYREGTRFILIFPDKS